MCILLLAAAIRILILEPFNIPSGSMVPTLLVGDYLLVSKYTYGYSTHTLAFGWLPLEGRWPPVSLPQRGDVIVFKLPSDNTTDYIKRIVGSPVIGSKCARGSFTSTISPSLES